MKKLQNLIFTEIHNYCFHMDLASVVEFGGTTENENPLVTAAAADTPFDESTPFGIQTIQGESLIDFERTSVDWHLVACLHEHFVVVVVEKLVTIVAIIQCLSIHLFCFVRL